MYPAVEDIQVHFLLFSRHRYFHSDEDWAGSAKECYDTNSPSDVTQVVFLLLSNQINPSEGIGRINESLGRADDAPIDFLSGSGQSGSIESRAGSTSAIVAD